MNFAKRLTPSEIEGNPAANNPRLFWIEEPRLSGTSRNNVSYTTVIRETKVGNVPDGWLAHPSGVWSQARFSDGDVITSELVNSPHYGDCSRAILSSLAVGFSLQHSEGLTIGRGTTWFECPTSLLQDRTDTTCTISGECLIELYQPVVLANLPAESGTSTRHGRYRFRISRVEASERGISVHLAVLGVELAFGDDWNITDDKLEILLINPNTSEHTEIGSMSGSASWGPGWLTMRRNLRIENRPDKEPSDSNTFLKDARLYLIGRRDGGTARIPFEMPDIELNADD